MKIFALTGKKIFETILCALCAIKNKIFKDQHQMYVINGYCREPFLRDANEFRNA